MRTELEIQRAHDLLIGILMGEAGASLTGKVANVTSASAHVLCWVLGHTHSHLDSRFDQLLVLLEEKMKADGFELRDSINNEHHAKYSVQPHNGPSPQPNQDSDPPAGLATPAAGHTPAGSGENSRHEERRDPPNPGSSEGGFSA